LNGIFQDQSTHKGEILNDYVSDITLAGALPVDLKGKVALIQHQAILRAVTEAHEGCFLTANLATTKKRKRKIIII